MEQHLEREESIDYLIPVPEDAFPIPEPVCGTRGENDRDNSLQRGLG